MNLNIIKNVNFSKITNTAKVVAFRLKEVRPEIMLGAGVAGVLAGTILACIKTNKAEPVIENMKTTHEELEFVRKNGQAEEKPTVREYVNCYGKGAVELVKIYALPVALWGGGMACILGSHSEMRSRNAELLANSVALKRFFDKYRAAVREKIGEDAEKEVYFGAKDEEIEVEETDPKTGERVTKKVKGKVFRDNQPGSMWARNFTSRTSDEFDVYSYIQSTLQGKIDYWNTRIRTEPFLTINDVYDDLRMKHGEGRCKEGMTVGWVNSPDVAPEDRQVHIDFLEGYEEVYDSVTGRTKFVKCLRLDFNCYPLEGLI